MKSHMKVIKTRGIIMGIALMYVSIISNPGISPKTETKTIQKPHKKHYIEKKKLEKNVLYFKKNIAIKSDEMLNANNA